MYCQYAVLNFNWTPTQFAKMGRKEKAFVIACINNKVRAEQKEKMKLNMR